MGNHSVLGRQDSSRPYSATRFPWTKLLAGCVAILLSVTAAQAADPAQDRGAEPIHAESKPPQPRRVWAVSIGISDYLYSDKGISDLQYADVDAWAFDALVGDKRFGGGGVPAEQRLLLLNKDATLAAVRSALLDFIGKAGRDDLVVVLFAGHGAPDPNRPEEMYLLVADTDPAKLASTALPMGDVRRAFERLRSEHVVFFADACHSAGIVTAGTKFRAIDDSNRINKYLGELGKIRRNRVVVTSSDADERSMEGRKWGHGVFTWALLEAVRGGADLSGNRDGIVQLGEAVDFVRDRVEKETAFQQHPVVAGEYDGRLPLALTTMALPARAEPSPPARAEPTPSANAGNAHGDARPGPTAGSTTPDKAQKPKKGKRLSPGPAGRVADIPARLPTYEFDGQTVEPAIQKPEVFYVLARTTFDFEAPQGELERTPPLIREAFDRWRGLRKVLDAVGNKVSAAGLARDAQLQVYDRQFAIPESASQAEKDANTKSRQAFCAKELKALQAAQDEREGARKRYAAATPVLRDLLAAEYLRDASPVTGLAPSLWAVLGELEGELAMQRWQDQWDQFDRAGQPDAPEPKREFKAATVMLDRFLDRFRVHPWRPRALYERAFYLSEADGVSSLEVAGQFLRVVAEVPDHPAAAEIHLRVAQAYFDSAEPRVQVLAREEILAALERTGPGHKLRHLVIYVAAWITARLDRRDEAVQHWLALLEEAKDTKGGMLLAEARQCVASAIFEQSSTAAVERSRLQPAAKAAIIGAAARLAADAQDFARATSWARLAIDLDPIGLDVPEADALVIRCLEEQGQLDEAAAALQSRFERFGPRSPWFKANAARCSPEFLGKLSDDTTRAAALRDKLRLAKAQPLGQRLDAHAIRGLFFGRLRWAYAQCYGEVPKLHPELQGKVVLEITWGEQGGVREAKVRTDTVGSPQLVACLIRRVAAVQNAPKAAARIVLPLVFHRPR